MARDPAYDGRSAKVSSATLKRSPAAPGTTGLLADTGRASAGLALGRCNYEAGAWKMHTDLADGGIAASDDDLMDAQGDQFADDRVRPVSSGVTVTVWPGFRPTGSCGSGVALAVDVAARATSSACSEVIGLRRPWPIAATRSAQLSSLGKPSSGAASGPKFCCKNQTGW